MLKKSGMGSGLMGLVMLLMICGTCSAAGERQCDGVLALSPIPENTSIAVVVESEGAVENLKWFNNDDEVVFPRVTVREAESGQVYSPGAVLAELTSVSGEAQAWTTVELGKSIQSCTGLFYVVFDLPAGATFVGKGTGGGPAIGYFSDATGRGAYVLSGDGSSARLVGTGAVDLIGSQAAGKAISARAGEATHALGGLAGPTLRTWPNPVTRSAEISFMLTRGGPFKLDIYDIRGRLVRNVASGPGAAGGCTRMWDGADNGGRQLPAGVYYARLAAENLVRTQRMVIVR